MKIVIISTFETVFNFSIDFQLTLWLMTLPVSIFLLNKFLLRGGRVPNICLFNPPNLLSMQIFWNYNIFTLVVRWCGPAHKMDCWLGCFPIDWKGCWIWLMMGTSSLVRKVLVGNATANMGNLNSDNTSV